MLPLNIPEFLISVAIFSVIPGPNTMMTIKNSMRGGFKDGAATCFGVSIVFFVHAIFSTCGLAIILYHSAEVYHTIKFVGAAYIAWLGIQNIYRAMKGTHTEPTGSDLEFAPCSVTKSFTEGVICNLLNPQACLFYVAFLPQFMNPEGNLVVQSCVLAALHCIIFLLWHCTIAKCVQKAKTVLTAPKVRARIDSVTGLALIGLGARMASSD